MISIGGAFFILVSIMLWVFITSKGNWAVKAALITSILYVFSSINNSTDSFYGWPSEASVPDKFQIHWVIINEPNRANDDPGSIYVWLTDIESESAESSGCNGAYINFKKNHSGQPRAYVMPYSVEKHESLEEAMSMIRDGNTVLAGKPNGELDGDQSEELSESDDFIIYKLPEVLLQPK